MPLHEISDALAGGGAPVGASVGGRDYLHAYMQYVKAVSNQDADAQRQTLNVAERSRPLGKKILYLKLKSAMHSPRLATPQSHKLAKAAFGLI